MCLICHNDLKHGTGGTRQLQCSHTFHKEVLTGSGLVLEGSEQVLVRSGLIFLFYYLFIFLPCSTCFFLFYLVFPGLPLVPAVSELVLPGFLLYVPVHRRVALEETAVSYVSCPGFSASDSALVIHAQGSLNYTSHNAPGERQTTLPITIKCTRKAFVLKQNCMNPEEKMV